MRLPVLLPLFASVLLAQAGPVEVPAPKPDPFAALRFLVGRWEAADSGGSPGQASRGEFSLLPDLGGRVLVRRSYAEYPAQGDRPAFRHDDLMTVYPEGGQLKALFLDNEGHVIHYEVTAASSGAVFTSSGPGPRFRLTYTPASADQVDLAFDIAPPGKDFASYLKARVRRKK